MTKEEKIKRYPKTAYFEVVDTVGVPHPFCITPKHLEEAHNRNSIYLGEDVIRSLESRTKKPSCGVKGCNLMFDDHKQALAVKCLTKEENPTRSYLESIVKLCEEDGFAGFVLVDATESEGEES